MRSKSEDAGPFARQPRARVTEKGMSVILARLLCLAREESRFLALMASLPALTASLLALLVGLAAMLLASPAWALTTVYVSSSLGSDSNAGTSSGAPWQTINKVRTAESAMTAGETVCMRGGDTWQSTGTSGTASAQLDLAGVTGSSGSPILFTSCAGFGSGRWILDENNTTQYCVDAIGTTVSYATIDQLECEHAKQMGVTFQTSGGTMPGITVSNSYIHDTGVGCSTSSTACLGTDTVYTYANQLDFEDSGQGADGVQFLNNIVKWGGGHNLLEVHHDTGAVVVQGNIVGPGAVHGNFDTKGVGSVATPALVANNICDGGASLGSVRNHSGGSGSSVSPCYYTENVYSPHSRLTYQDNIGYDINVAMQICPGGVASGHTVDNAYKVYNNTFYMNNNNASTAAGGAYGGITCNGANVGTYNGSTLDLRNNVFDGGASGGNGTMTIANDGGYTSCTEDYNDIGGVQGNKGYVGCAGSTTLAAHDKNAVNPQYVSASTGVFDFLAGSALINAGLSGLVTGNTNIGAYAGSGVTTATPGVAVEGWFE